MNPEPNVGSQTPSEAPSPGPSVHAALGPNFNPAVDASERVYEPAHVRRSEHAEPSFTRLIEQHTAKVPSHWFLFAAFTTMGASLILEFAGNQRWSRFVGMWPSALLITGVYNKLVKTLGPS